MFQKINSLLKKISRVPNISKPVGEVIGINKISYKLMRKIFLFMDNYFKKKNRKFSWEIVINNFIQENPKSFKILKPKLSVDKHQ